LTRRQQFAIILNEPLRRRAAGVRGPISLRISILASGSSGNATLLETEQTCLLVDAGIGKKEMMRRFAALGRAPERVDAILVSHEHTDHSSGLPQLLREWRCTGYLTEGTHQEILRALPEASGKKMTRVEHVRPGQRFTIGDIEVAAFVIPHDAIDPVGYTFRAQGCKVAVVTDLGYLPELVKQHLRDADFLILESNHDLEMLKVGPYPWFVKQRVMSRTGHLSNHVVSEFLADGDAFDGRARYLVMAHISETNNNPDVVRLCAEEALGRRPAAFQGELLVASQHVPLGPFQL
jgi:phosphoribosyl 1,2-cyclic phosphodiesterase